MTEAPDTVSIASSNTVGAVPTRRLATTHERVGLLYFLTACALLLVAFGIVLLMRWQLAYPGTAVPGLAGLFDARHPWLPQGVLQPNFYNQLAGMHGTIMIFLAVVPLLVGAFGLYLVPPMIGARDLALPWVAWLSYALYLGGALVVLGSFFAQDGPASTGWTAYPPLASIEPSGQTWWLVGMVGVYGSSLCLAITLIVTIVTQRSADMPYMRMPFLIWSQLITALLLLLSFPALAAASALQLSDRLLGSSFFLPSGLVISDQPLEVAGGGSALLWQHLFWFLAHPEVYVLLLPALGIVAEVLTTNARQPLFGYKACVFAVCLMGVLSLFVWAHHMYLTGMAESLNTFFQTTTVIISLPSVIIGGSLVLTLWGGRLYFPVPMLFAIVFLPMFAIGGFTGLPLALAATNVHLHDTYYVVGHFHYIVAPGTLFAIFAGIYHWFPRVTGRHMGTWLGHAHLWTSLLFMNATFMPMLLQGLAGVNRRLYDGGESYAHAQDVFFLNKAATHSAIALAVVQGFFVVNFFWSLFRGARADANPWGSTTREWGRGAAEAPAGEAAQ